MTYYRISGIIDPINSKEDIEHNNPRDYLTFEFESDDVRSVKWILSIIGDRIIEGGFIEEVKRLEHV